MSTHVDVGGFRHDGDPPLFLDRRYDDATIAALRRAFDVGGVAVKRTFAADVDEGSVTLHYFDSSDGRLVLVDRDIVRLSTTVVIGVQSRNTP
jgi:hypothetical protein